MASDSSSGGGGGSGNSREARRRKILDRGADRLALISGQIQMLPSQPPDSDVPSQPFDSHADVSATVSPDVTDGALGSSLSNNDPAINSSHGGGSLVEPPLCCYVSSVEDSEAPGVDASSSARFGTAAEAPVARASDISRSEEPSFVPPVDQKSTIHTSGAERHMQPRTLQKKLATSSQISSAIAASERSRLFVSITIALLVLFSYVGVPLLGSSMTKSIIGFRPLYLVLLTNFTLVIMRLLSDNQRGFERGTEGDHRAPPTDGQDWTEQAGKALEIGLLMQKAIDAIVMDCSMYAIIIICGLSFV